MADRLNTFNPPASASSPQTSGEPALSPEALFAELSRFPTLQPLGSAGFSLLRGTELLVLAPDQVFIHPNERVSAYYAVLSGEIAVEKHEHASSYNLITMHAGETFGEVPLLLGWAAAGAQCRATQPSRLLRIPEDSFWSLMAHAPACRQAILADQVRRSQTYQAQTLHREKLISLGTLAAGLMHELNNPGTAARRAAAQLRDNLTQLQQISLRMTRNPLNAEQLTCLADMQEQVFSSTRHQSNLSPLEQSDREEELAAWLEQLGVPNAWAVAPTFIGAGWSRDDIACAQASFPAATLSDALSYLHALISSMQQVGTIEESITRVTDLVTAVKKYAYDDKNREQRIDVRESLRSTLTILKHKFHHKSIHVELDLPTTEVNISCMGVGLSQVWTNLLDNAIDAAPEQSTVRVRLWTEPGMVCVGVLDHGPGIAPEHRDHIFEPFYTTKAPGVGTGMGLDIAHRIVVVSFHGQIHFDSTPGQTEFIVRLPMARAGAAQAEGCQVAQ